MKLLIQIEWMKLIRQRKAKVLLGLTWISALILSLGNLYLNNRVNFTVISGDQMPLTIITLLGALLLPLVVYIMAVDTTSSDYTNGTIKYGLMAPAQRHHLYFAKLSALSLYNALILSGVMLMAFISNLFVMKENILLNLATYLSAYLLTMVPMVLISLWGMLMGSYFSSGLSLGLGIIGVLALNVGQIFIPVLASVSPLGYMNLYNQILYGNVSMMALVSTLLYLTSYYIILITLNIRRVQTKEI